MKIDHSTRVVYANNPLSEVICQLRFEPTNFSEEKIEAICKRFFLLDYTTYSEEQSFGFQQQLGSDGQTIQATVTIPKIRIHHCTSSNGIWRVSFCPEFIALTCLKYLTWNDFLDRILDAVAAFTSDNLSVNATRLGLRYRDVIEREAIGLENVPWHELIQPFLLGPLVPFALSKTQAVDDSDVVSFMSQAQLKIDEGLLLLQSTVMSSIDGQRQAFLIDADFFNEYELGDQPISATNILEESLEKLHLNAGALFRRCISEKLHHALKPIN